jgi:hypothetical protein
MAGPPLEDTYLTFGQVERLAKMTRRQLDYLVRQQEVQLIRNHPGRGHPRMWGPDMARRMQVIDTLNHALGEAGERRQETAIIEPVLAGPNPTPTRWVAVSNQGVFYVNLISELEMKVDYWLLVAVMPALWPDVSPAFYRWVLTGKVPEEVE